MSGPMADLFPPRTNPNANDWRRTAEAEAAYQAAVEAMAARIATTRADADRRAREARATGEREAAKAERARVRRASAVGGGRTLGAAVRSAESVAVREVRTAREARSR